jgi:hypothetical protein
MNLIAARSLEAYILKKLMLLIVLAEIKLINYFYVLIRYFTLVVAENNHFYSEYIGS